jgi:hypothetical protein
MSHQCGRQFRVKVQEFRKKVLLIERGYARSRSVWRSYSVNMAAEYDFCGS